MRLKYSHLCLEKEMSYKPPWKVANTADQEVSPLLIIDIHTFVVTPEFLVRVRDNKTVGATRCVHILVFM